MAVLQTKSNIQENSVPGTARVGLGLDFKPIPQIGSYGGTRLNVSYYLRMYGESDQHLKYDHNLDESTTQFVRIKNFIVNSHDDITINAQNITGSGDVLVGVTPTIGDVFIYMLDGKKILMSVDDVTPINYLDTQAYTINYSDYCILDDYPDIETKINNSIVYDYVYDMELSKYSGSPLFDTADLFMRKTAYKKSDKILSEYIDRHFNYEYMIFAIDPASPKLIGDRMVEKFIWATQDVHKEPFRDTIKINIRNIRHKSLNAYEYILGSPTSKHSVRGLYRPYDIDRYLGMECRHTYILEDKIIGIVGTTPVDTLENSSLFYNCGLLDNPFSIDFYNGVPVIPFEIETLKMINNESLDINVINSMIDSNMSNRQSYYYIPILLTMLKYLAYRRN